MRFLSYYQMNRNPFSKYVDEWQIYESEDVLEAVARIEYAVEIDSIALITGEPGTGKTTVVRKYINTLDPEIYKLIYISSGNFKVFDFYQALCNSLDIPTERCQKVDMYKRIQKEFVRMQREERMKPVVVIDDAQLLPSKVIDEFKIFYDFDFDSRCYVSVILIGNEGIRKRMRQIKYESLKDRIVTNYEMKGLTLEETEQYISSRLESAGAKKDLFDKQVVNAIYHASKGNCRRANSLLTSMLMLGYGHKRIEFTIEDVKKARDEMRV